MKTVNFLEAINSNRRFRLYPPVEGYGWISCTPDMRRLYWGMCKEFTLTDYEFFNSQFELEEKEITISESEFDMAWCAMMATESSSLPFAIKKAEILKEKLGFSL